MNIDELRIGDLFLVDGSGLISKAIEDVEYGRRKVARRYSHVAGYIGNGQLIEAEGFRKTGYAPASKYAGCADVFRCVSLTREQQKQILRLALWRVGGQYDYLLLGMEFIRCAFGIVIPYREPPNARICSTLWAVGIYRNIGIDLCPGIRWPTPKDVAESKLLAKIGSY